MPGVIGMVPMPATVRTVFTAVLLTVVFAAMCAAVPSVLRVIWVSAVYIGRSVLPIVVMTGRTIYHLIHLRGPSVSQIGRM